MTRAVRRAATILLTGITSAAAPVGAQDAQFTGEATVNIVEVPVRVFDPANGVAPVAVPAAEISQARARGYFSYVLTVELEGGRQKLWVGVEDLFSNRISIMPQELDL